MDPNNYYNGKGPRPDHSQSPSPYEPYGGAPSTVSYPEPPAYSSQQYLGQPNGRPNQQQPVNGNSPFDSVFDDNAYPMNGQRNQMGQNGRPQQQQDTGYYGGGTFQRQDSDPMASRDDIPLQERLDRHKQQHGSHVDDPEGGMPGAAAGGSDGRGRSMKQKIRFGELGMLTSGKQKIAWVCWIFFIIQSAVFIGEIVKNAQLTGSPIMIRPQFNPMIGPTPYVLINMGARYMPCMHNVDGVQDSPNVISWPCPNMTTQAPACTLSELCGFGGVPEPQYGRRTGKNGQPGPDKDNQPNQWFRFITPIFMHAGLIHIGFNMLLQLTLGREMEQAIGSIRFFLVYMSAGIFGFVLGGNYAGAGTPSTGASGSLFGVIALTLIDLLYSWKDRKNPVKDLLFIFLDIAISFVLGLLPGLDNFSHIGGFLMGLGLGVCLLHSPNSLRRRIGVDAPPYASVTSGQDSQTAPPFHKNPIGFFKGRKPLWWAWWLIRAGALVIVTIGFILLLNNFYVVHQKCSWCKYLSCININNWCEMEDLRFENTTAPTSSAASPAATGAQLLGGF
ncbi:hypothetical protein MCOR27_005259 [Pyricularia oryzae]|uniref:Rhomboid-type serine protease n=2 Tax=Pyricularia TaxID=48558 RepID=A0ABQ8P0R1_PYRGI|nr:hypothetical protein MCOR01_000242 [Pyricularia oryzae]KAI6304834.1 hypothetical protein MCOR33_000345 [Pyricularia grisea]KAI6255224.1 hypothetical protein MCOR19_008303 [Pyricularia oryzae]KAI6279253.1 hypothetical protein MCOR27_005259 [Pyricularia oryzae]KAI6287628.1 hypothetical protein MCOR26_000526 [Pyricularia oryzae]